MILDLSGLNSLTSKLDLSVFAAYYIVRAIERGGVVSQKIASQVEALTLESKANGPRRLFSERGVGLSLIIEVTSCETWSCDHKFSNRPNGN